jgi:hypothetical protein
MSATESTDMGFGLGLTLVVLAVGGAVVSLLAPGTETAAWGFAAAVTLGTLAVAAIHVYG